MTRRVFLLLAFTAWVSLGHLPTAAAQEWEKVLAAAKKEGKVAIIGPVGADRRDVLVEPFQKKYGITVEYFADRGSGIGPRLSTERGAGQYLWDAAITGTTTGLLSLLPGGMLDPMEPALVLPDVKDPKQWRGGALDFVDPGRRFLVMTPSQRGTLFVNPKVTKPQEIKSYKDLLNPKWRKKIVMDDPTRAGPGQATFTFFYLHPELGPKFYSRLGQTRARDPARLYSADRRHRPGKIFHIDRGFRHCRGGTHKGRFTHRDSGSTTDQGRLRRQPGFGRLGVFQSSATPKRCQGLYQLAVVQRGAGGVRQGQWLHQRALGRAHGSFAVESADTGFDQDLHATSDRYQRRPHRIIQRSFRSLNEKYSEGCQCFL